MIEGREAVHIVNEIKMSNHKGTFLLVESDTDARLFRNFINDEECQIIPAENKENVINICTFLNSEGFYKHLGIVDLDYDFIDRKNNDLDRLFHTDTHDIETMILQSPAFDKIVFEYTNINTLEDFINDCKKRFRDFLLRNGKPIGILRIISKIEFMKLRFKELNYENCMDKRFRIALNKLISKIIENTKKCAIDKKILEKKVAEFDASKYDPWLICQGHDLTKILFIWLKRKLINKMDKQELLGWSVEYLEKDLRLSYDFEYFKKTSLFSAIKEWESEIGLTVFKNIDEN